MSAPQTASLPVGGDERNLLVDPVNGLYRLTKEGTDVRTADPLVSPEGFEFTEDTLSADIVLATGSFIPDSVGTSNIPLGVTSSERTGLLFYPKVGNVYYFRPATKGKFNSFPTYSTYENVSVIRQPVFSSAVSDPPRVGFGGPGVFDTPNAADWSRDPGFHSLPWRSNTLNWIQIDMEPVKPVPNPVLGDRFKVRSAADGGGFMITKSGRNLTSTDPADYIVHPDKKSFQFIAEFIVTVASGASVLLPLPVGSGRSMPLIFVAGNSTYITPFIRDGFSIAQCSFEYVSGGVLFTNTGGSADNRFHVAFTNVEMAL